MLNEDLSMLRCWCGWLFVFLLAAIASGCTKQNPRSCADGSCNDIAFPFCDVDGTVAGEPNTCIAVSCTPGALEACRGDEAITCNGMGNNFDVTQCERGCDEASGGCRGCESSDQCANPTPVCDTGTSECRACTVDDECASRVCDVGAGSCVAASAVVYAAPSGVNSGACTLDQPCSLARAVTVASTAAVTPVLRLLPGTFIDPLQLVMPTTSALQVVATGATIGSTSAGLPVQVGGGANVQIRNLTINDTGAVDCSDASVASTIVLSSSTITATSAISVSNCTATLHDVDVTILGASGDALFVRGPAAVQAERLHVRADLGSSINVLGQLVSLRVVNSVFEHILVSPGTTDTMDPGSKLLFAFDTFLMDDNVQHGCQVNAGSAHRTMLFENTIIKGTGTRDVIFGTGGCTLLHNILTPQSVNVPATNSTMDPQFVDIPNRNLHLKSGSPAIDTAVPSTGLDPTTDFDGVARPQGTAKDVGAFEFKP